jgi:peptidoglycan/LPS O-acetylase OafA/YrhL
LVGIEGLRGLAACSILLYHVWLYSQPPREMADIGPLSRYVLRNLPLGVTLFFTLSAFLLYRPIAAAVVDRTPRPRTGAYLVNRALRILPAYWVVLGITAVVLPAAVLRTGVRTIELGRMADDPGLLARNAALVQNYSPQSVLTGIAPAWSLAIEAVFYLVLPLLGLLAAACARPCGRAGGRLVAALVPAGVLLLVGLSGRAAADRWIVSDGSPSAGWDGDWHSVVVRSFWAQADLFTLGIVLAVVAVGLERDMFTLPRWWRPVAWTALPMIAVALAVLTDRGFWSAGRAPYELAGSVGCALVLAVVVLPPPAGRPGLAARMLSGRVVVLIGLCSYSIFLWHEPLVRLLRSQGLTLPGRAGLLVNLALVAALTAAVSAATYKWVEQPALRKRAASRRETTTRG